MRVLGVVDLLPLCGGRDRKIAAIAAAQRGRVARRQLLAAGISDNTISRMLGDGRLHRLHAGVYAVGHLAPTELGRETAALLASRDGAVLSHHTAAALWKLRPALGADGPVDVTVLGGGAVRRAGIRTHRTRRLDSGEIRVLERLPITSPARTLLDIAMLLSERELERALDEGIMRRIVRGPELAAVLQRTKGRRGSALLDALLARRAGPTITRSQAEERFLALVRAAGLPEPRTNVRLRGFEVDFLWVAQKLVVEVDGYAFHASRSAFEHDRVKGRRLTAAGLNVMRVTWRQMQDESYSVIASVAQALGWADARRSS